MRSFSSGMRVKMKTVSPAAMEIFSSRLKMFWQASSHSSGDWSVVKPSSARRAMSRVTTSVPSGDSVGFSAFSSCIFLHEIDQVLEFKRFAEVVVRAALARLFSDVTVAGHDDVRNVFRLRLGFEAAAEGVATHPLD